MEKLSSEELQTKVDAINSTVVTLKLAINDISCEKTRQKLLIQIDTYNDSIRQILLELSRRRIKIN